MSQGIIAPDGHPRCPWCVGTAALLAYHDQEWGFPVDDDQRLFEKLCLESFQSGLSWRTILNKREHFRAAFHHFDFHQVARFGEEDVQRLLQDAGIIRHRGKIEAAINNAKRAKEMVEQEGSLAAFFWRYEPTELAAPHTQTTSPESVALAKELKQRGWKFFGPTTAFAFMQAMGLVNDHVEGCVIRERVARAREQFVPPSKQQTPTA